MKNRLKAILFASLMITVILPFNMMDISATLVKKNSLFQYQMILESPIAQIKSGIKAQDVICRNNLQLLFKLIDDSPFCVKPETKQKLIERGWARPAIIENILDSRYAEKNTIVKLLTQNQIDYIQDNLVVAEGPVTRGDPRCGAVLDVNGVVHWFTVNSISKPQKMTLYSENPSPCEVNTTSCFCNAQMQLTELTLEELSYFSPEEEEIVANTLIDYLVKENINRTRKFMIGKFNINYTDLSAIGYCGELSGYNTIKYFEGAIVNDQVKDYGLKKELSSLCAITENAQWREKK